MGVTAPFFLQSKVVGTAVTFSYLNDYVSADLGLDILLYPFLDA